MKVAVYGSLRKGLGNHRLLESSEFLGVSELPDCFKMYSLGAFPYVSKEITPHPVVCEVYSIDDATLQNLDFLEGYPSFYDREEVELEGFGACNVYYIRNDDGYKGDEIDTGDWSEYVRTR